MFYWASKAAISIENGLFSSKSRELGMFFQLEYEHGIGFGR